MTITVGTKLTLKLVAVVTLGKEDDNKIVTKEVVGFDTTPGFTDCFFLKGSNAKWRQFSGTLGQPQIRSIGGRAKRSYEIITNS